jgi:hypothetical protein
LRNLPGAEQALTDSYDRKVAAAITIPVTKAPMQENSTVSMTTLIIRTLQFFTTVDQRPDLAER